MPGYKRGGQPLKTLLGPSNSNLCCRCGPDPYRNCNCRRVEWRGLPFSLTNVVPEEIDQDIYFDFVDNNDYTFYYEQPFLVVLFMGGGTAVGEFVDSCSCIPISDLDDDGDCGLVCQIDNTYSGGFPGSPCQDNNQCFRCGSMGPGFSLLPNDTVGKVSGDPCIYLDPTGYGSVPGKCHSIAYVVPFLGDHECCNIGGSYELEHNSPGSSVCMYSWFWDDMKCIQPWPPETVPDVSHPRRVNPPMCVANGGAAIEVFVDRGFYGTGVDIAPCWVALLRMSTIHKDSIGETFLGVTRYYWYRGEALPFSGTYNPGGGDDSDSVNCIRTQGSHTLNLVHTHMEPIGGAGLGEYEWCIPPSTITVLAHGAAPDGPYW